MEEEEEEEPCVKCHRLLLFLILIRRHHHSEALAAFLIRSQQILPFCHHHPRVRIINRISITVLGPLEPYRKICTEPMIPPFNLLPPQPITPQRRSHRHWYSILPRVAVVGSPARPLLFLLFLRRTIHDNNSTSLLLRHRQPPLTWLKSFCKWLPDAS